MEQDVGKQELAAAMIHYLLTHFRSEFLHPPVAVGNRRHCGTSVLPQAAMVPSECARLGQHFMWQQRSGKNTVCDCSSRQGRDPWKGPKHVLELSSEPCRSSQGCGTEEGKAANRCWAGGQGGFVGREG